MTELKTSQGTVDVVIPAYNADRFITHTLESVAKQTYPINSVIVVNDGSTDETQALVLAFARTHLHLKTTLLNQTNLGLSAARNTGILHATADYIAFLDADDLWAPEKLAQQMNVFACKTWPNLGIVYCAYQIVDESGQVVASSSRDVINPKHRGNIYQQLLLGNFISGSGSSVLIKRSVFSEIGLFDQNLRACEDWDMWMRIAKQYQFDFVKEPLVFIRVHQSNMQKDSLRMLSAELMVLDKFYAQGDKNTFLLWKIRIFLLNKRLSAFSIPGFDQCSEKLQSELLGWPMTLAAVLAAPFRALAYLFLKIQGGNKRQSDAQKY